MRRALLLAVEYSLRALIARLDAVKVWADQEDDDA